MDRNSTDFPRKLNELIRKLEPHEDLRMNQQIVNMYMGKARGIIAMHETGSGKTRLSAAVISAHIGKTIVVAPKSVHDNMRVELRRWNCEDRVSFVTLGSSAMMRQLRKESKTPAELEMDPDGPPRLGGKLLVVDEAHNLANAITNGSETAMEFYDVVRVTKDLKVVFLTATPCINHPFEIVPLVNMVSHSDLLPTDYDEFVEFFVKDDHPNRVGKLKSRLVGLISYFGDFYRKDAKGKRPDYPEERPIELVKVEMSPYQYAQYVLARNIEQDEGKGKGGTKSGGPMTKPKSLFSSSYRALSRAYSNIAPPHIEVVNGRPKSKHYDYSDISDDLGKYSPKLVELRKRLGEPGRHLIYSSFVEQGGVETIIEMLRDMGVGEYKTGGRPIEVDIAIIDEYWKSGVAPVLGGGAKDRMIVVTGKTKAEDRQDMVDAFNNDKSYRYVVISSAGAEGLDLHGINWEHIMEPHWNHLRLIQVIGRGVRFRSHVDFKDKWVQPLVYISDYPKGKSDRLIEAEITTNASMYANSIKNYILIRRFYQVFAEVAIDCAYHNANPRIKCFDCMPDGARMFVENFHEDIGLPMTCKRAEAKEIKAETFTFDGRSFAKYRRNGELVVLEQRDDLGGYVEAQIGDPVWKSPHVT